MGRLVSAIATKSSRFRFAQIVRPALLVAILCVVYLAYIYLHYQRDDGQWFEFVRPTPAGSAGYDGQFTYCIALDPSFATSCLDVPAYRYQRILHPILARYVGLLDAIRIIQAMLAINVLMLAVGTLVMSTLSSEMGVSAWYALIYGLFGGLFFAVRVNTAEPLAYGLVLLAILAGQRERWWLNALLLGLAAFAKETILITTAGYLLYFAVQGRWKDAIRLGIVGVVPFVIWQFILRSWFGSFGVGSGGAMATPFEIIPFMGIWRIGLEFGSAVFLRFGALLLPFAVLPAVWALWQCWREAVKRRWHPYLFVMFTNAAIMLMVPFSTYREPLGITRFMPGLVIGLVLFAALRRHKRALLYSTMWLLWGLTLLG